MILSTQERTTGRSEVQEVQHNFLVHSGDWGQSTIHEVCLKRKQNSFSSFLKVSITLKSSNMVQVSYFSSETQGNLLTMSPYKITNELHSCNYTITQNKLFLPEKIKVNTIRKKLTQYFPIIQRLILRTSSTVILQFFSEIFIYWVYAFFEDFEPNNIEENFYIY